MIIYILSWVGSISDVCSTLPQLWKCRHRNSTHNLAMGMILLRLLGAVCWSVWAYYHQALPLFLCHSVAFVVELLLLCCFLRDLSNPPNDSVCNDGLPVVLNMPCEQGTLQQIQNKNKQVEL